MTYMNFLSYNSTGLGTAKIEWINEVLDNCKIDFAQIQEHFQKSKNINSKFDRYFPNYDNYIIPGVRSNAQDFGRAEGGLAQLINKKIYIKKERIDTIHWRIQAQIIYFFRKSEDFMD